MRVLVLGLVFSQNLGDEVIARCAAWLLEKNLPGVQTQVYDFTGREERSTSADPMRRVLRHCLNGQVRTALARCGMERRQWEYLQLRQSWDEEKVQRLAKTPCDAVVFAGGEVFDDELALYLVRLARSFNARGIPVFFNACGAGPAGNRQVRRLLAEALALPCVRLVSVRDYARRVSERYLPEGRRAQVTADPALFTREVYGVERDPDSRTIGVGIALARNLPFLPQLRFWRRMLLLLERQGVPYRVFTNGDSADLSFVRLIFSRTPRLRGREGERILPQPHEPRELIEQIAGFAGIIGMRLHSHIIAVSLDIPSVAVVWDEKLPAFFAKIRHPERCFTISDRPQDVWAGLEKAREQGLDQGLIGRQKRAAERLLVRAVRELQQEQKQEAEE